MISLSNREVLFERLSGKVNKTSSRIFTDRSADGKKFLQVDFTIQNRPGHKVLWSHNNTAQN